MTRIRRGLGVAATVWTLALSGSANAVVLQFDVSSTNIYGSFDIQYIFDTSELLSSIITDSENFQ